MNNIFDLLKLLNGFNQPQNNPQPSKSNPSYQNYPSDAFTQNTNINQQNPFSQIMGGENNLLPLLMSMMGKSGDLGKIFAQNTNKKEEVKKETSSPKDEILL